MSDGDKRLNDLGYIIVECVENKKLKYSDGLTYIEFDLTYNNFTIYNHGYFDRYPADVGMFTLKAIYEKCKDLGFLDGGKK